MAVKKMTCEQAFTKHTISVENPNYKVGNYEPMTYIKYKGKTVFFHYCKDSWKVYSIMATSFNIEAISKLLKQVSLITMHTKLIF